MEASTAVMATANMEATKPEAPELDELANSKEKKKTNEQSVSIINPPKGPFDLIH